MRNRTPAKGSPPAGDLAEDLLRPLSRAFERGPTMIMITDRDGKIEYVNPKFTAVTGYTAEEVIGKHVSDLGDHPAEEEKQLWASLAAGVEWRGEFRNSRKNGEVYWLSAYITPVRSEDGVITHFLGINENISERKRAEEAPRQAEARNSALLRAMPDMMFRVSRDGVYLEFIPGDELEPLLSPSEFLGKRMNEVGLPPEVVQQSERHLKRALETGRTQLYEYQLEIAAEVRHYEARIVPSGRDEVLAMVRDVTERRRTGEALRESEERYRVLYEDNPSMYFTVDTEGTVRSVNRFGAEQLGYTADELVGQSVLKVFYEADKEGVREQLALCVQNPAKVAEWEFRKVRKDGSVLWAKEAARAVRGPDGDMIVLIVCEDISQRKQAVEALQEAREELEAKVESQMRGENPYGLTFRELTALHLVAEGKSDKEIATLLGISPHTANKHLENILSKMGASSRTEAGVRAVREGLLR